MSPRDGEQTRQKILDAAEALILKQGFAATSVDQLIQRAGMTKGTFFYHFDTKAALAHALIERYAQRDLANLHGNLQRAEKLSKDPLQQLLIFVGLFLEIAEELEEPYPGCLFASYCYESEAFAPETLEIAADVHREWRQVLSAKIREIVAAHPPRAEVNPEGLADMLTVVFEGAFIMSRTLSEAKVFAQQLREYRTHLELLFGAP